MRSIDPGREVFSGQTAPLPPAPPPPIPRPAAAVSSEVAVSLSVVERKIAALTAQIDRLGIQRAVLIELREELLHGQRLAGD